MAVVAAAAELRIFQRTVTVPTPDAEQLHDLTDTAQAFVDECEVETGLILACSLHTTAGLLLNECESGLRADFRALADTLVPSCRPYRHDDMSVRHENLCPEDYEAPNGHAHLQQTLFGAPVVPLPVFAGELVLGRWQRLLLVEYDRPRERTVVLQLFGLAAAERPA